MKKVLLTIVSALAFVICASAQTPEFDVKSNDSEVAKVLADATISADDLSSHIDFAKLDQLVEEDEEMSLSNKTSYRMLVDLGDASAREKALRKAPYYKYVRENLYPKAYKK